MRKKVEKTTKFKDILSIVLRIILLTTPNRNTLKTTVKAIKIVLMTQTTVNLRAPLFYNTNNLTFYYYNCSFQSLLDSLRYLKYRYWLTVYQKNDVRSRFYLSFE